MINAHLNVVDFGVNSFIIFILPCACHVLYVLYESYFINPCVH